jgi:ubiquitin C-terminal hydrolase
LIETLQTQTVETVEKSTEKPSADQGKPLWKRFSSLQVDANKQPIAAPVAQNSNLIPRLPNDNRSCFANAALQCINRTAALKNAIATFNMPTTVGNDVAQLISAILTGEKRYTARHLRNTVGQPYSNEEDSDAAEFLLKLLDYFECIGRLFQLRMEQRKQCDLCSSRTIVDGNFDCLQLSGVLNPPLQFDRLVLYAINNAPFPEPGRMRCDQCGDLTGCQDENIVDQTRMPRYMVLPIGRFHDDGRKTNHQIQGFNPDSHAFGTLQYRTIAAMVHYGPGLKTGHYTALIRLPNDQWVEVSDENIKDTVFPQNLKGITLLCCEKSAN